MADKPEAGEEEPQKGGRLKLVVFAVAGLLVLGGGGAGAAWFFGLFGGSTDAAEAATDAAAAGEHGAAEEHGAAGHGGRGESGGAGRAGRVPAVAFLELPDVLVNLQSPGQRMRYLKLALALEVNDEATAEALRALTPRIMDSIQLYLRALTVDDVRGAIGMERLKQEMTARINRAVAPLRVSGVLVKEMLVQ